MNEAFVHYSAHGAHAGEPLCGAHSGSAGGAPCGDLIQLSLRLEAGQLCDVRWQAEGCAAARAAAAAAAELLDGAGLAEAALIDAAAIDAELGELALSGEPLLDEPIEGERVLVAMSGGVDSAVATLREQRSGADVFAVTLELWSDPANDGDASCCSPQAVRLARSVAHSMGVPHLTLDLRERFREGVVAPFLEGYAAGVTPNPCVICNGSIRLEPMIELARRLGAVGLATGHYARLADDGEGPLLAAADDPAKDQAYMLAALPAAQLARMRFPLGELRKPEVRALAAEAELPVAGRAESQDLCFLAGEGKSGFLQRHGGLQPREGRIEDAGGALLGSHSGHHNFTVGQRRGIGLGAPEPLYVLATNAETNTVTVGSEDELQRRSVSVHGAVLRRGTERIGSVKLRYRARALGCRARSGAHGCVELELDQPTRRPAAGQTAVFFDGDLIIGHGTIC